MNLEKNLENLTKAKTWPEALLKGAALWGIILGGVTAIVGIAVLLCAFPLASIGVIAFGFYLYTAWTVKNS